MTGRGTSTAAAIATRCGVETAVNEVRLLGRLSVDARRRTLPSGVELVEVRLVVPRPADRRDAAEARRPVTVDTIEVSCWPGPQQDLAALLVRGDVVEVRGSLRRRFFRTGGGPQSRYEVHAEEVLAVSLVGEEPTEPRPGEEEDPPLESQHD